MSQEYVTASWTDRAVAIFIDLIVLWLLKQVLPFTTVYYELLPEDLISGLMEFLSKTEMYLIAPIYFILLRYFWNGQTIGKKLLALRTVPGHGGKLKLW